MKTTAKDLMEILDKELSELKEYDLEKSDFIARIEFKNKIVKCLQINNSLILSDVGYGIVYGYAEQIQGIKEKLYEE